jgi:hypothetical protein
MTTDGSAASAGMPAGAPISIDDVFRTVPVQSADDLACEGIFDTDEELDEFLEHVYAARRADLA